FGRGACAEIEPLFTMRPPRGSWLFIMRIASCVHRKTPVRLISTTFFHCSNVRSSRLTAGAPMPALLKRKSSRPKASLVCANSARRQRVDREIDPFERLDVVLRHAGAIGIEQSEVELRQRDTLIGRTAEPFRGGLHVLAHARTLDVACAEVVLRHRLALLGG